MTSRSVKPCASVVRAAVRHAACALLLLAVANASAQNVVELGPAPIGNGGYTGRVSALVCSPTDPERYFVAGADGGVWRTIDGGQTWKPLMDDRPTLSIGALLLDPTDENVIYAGTGEANYANHSRYGLGLYKSTDGGDTWTQLAENVFGGRCFSKIVTHSNSSQTLFAAITRAGGFPELAAAKGHPGAAGPVGVFRSTDGGVSWTQLTNGLPNLSATDLAIDPRHPNVLYAGIGRIFGAPENGIYKSTDGGASWTKLAGGLPDDSVGRISIGVAPPAPSTRGNPAIGGPAAGVTPQSAGRAGSPGGAPRPPSRVYALITRASDEFGGEAGTRGAYRSDDGGATWTDLALGGIQATYGWYLSFVSVQPGSEDTVFMGGLTLARSTVGGGSWRTVTPPHVDMHAAGWDAAGRLVVGDDGGVHRSTNLGGSWVSLNNGLGLIQFYAGLSTSPIEDEIVFGGAQDNGSNRRNTASRTWSRVLGGDGGWTQVDQTNPARVFAEFQGTGNLYRSTNGGSSFSRSRTGIVGTDRHCFLPPYVIDPSDPNIMLYGTHRVYLSTTGGGSWTPISGDLTNGAGAIRALAMAPSDSDVVYAATNDGNVLVSFDRGASFELILSGHPGWPRVTREIHIDPNDPMTMYLAVASFGETQIRRTRDAGRTFEAVDGDLPDIPVNVVAIDVRGAATVLFAGTDMGLYRSVDDGQTWHRFGVGLPHAVVIDLLVDTARDRLTIGTQGRGAWRMAIGIPGDMNGDGRVDGADIDPLILSLGDPQAFAREFPQVDPIACGDLDGNGELNGADIDGFVKLLRPEE